MAKKHCVVKPNLYIDMMTFIRHFSLIALIPHSVPSTYSQSDDKNGNSCRASTADKV